MLPAKATPPFTVRGTEILPTDTPEERHQKLARIRLGEQPGLAFVLDVDGTLLECSRATLEGSGLTRAEIVGQPFWETFWWTVSSKTQENLQSAVQRAASGEVVRYDVELYVRKSGAEVMVVDFTLLPVRDEQGRVVYLLPEGRDVTEKARAQASAGEGGELRGLLEQAREETRAALGREQEARLEVERQKQLAEGLRQAVESANRAKEEFLAMLGHELRNPLSPILTALDLMKLRGQEESERARTVIARQVDHLTRLVDDLLDVARMARGQVELKREVIEISAVVAKAIEMASPLLEQRAHTLTVDMPMRGLRVEGDPSRLGQVVANLLTNAAKYTPKEGKITVRAQLQGEEVVLRVRDDGRGIAKEALPKVFDSFVQERQAIDRSAGGLGIGLAIVKNLVDRHGGSVEAHSEGAGQGSEFVVRLPALAPASERPSTAPTPSRAPGPQAGAIRVLIVDDNEDAAAMLALSLKRRGYEIRVAHDGPTALRAAEQFAPESALLDIGLPVMDGYELASRLRRLPGLEGIRLVALTGYGQDSDREKTRQAGFQHHLVKPVTIDAVEAALRSQGAA